MVARFVPVADLARGVGTSGAAVRGAGERAPRCRGASGAGAAAAGGGGASSCNGCPGGGMAHAQACRFSVGGAVEAAGIVDGAVCAARLCSGFGSLPRHFWGKCVCMRTCFFFVRSAFAFAPRRRFSFSCRARASRRRKELFVERGPNPQRLVCTTCAARQWGRCSRTARSCLMSILQCNLLGFGISWPVGRCAQKQHVLNSYGKRGICRASLRVLTSMCRSWLQLRWRRELCRYMRSWLQRGDPFGVFLLSKRG